MPMYHDMGKMWRFTRLTTKPYSSPNEETTYINTFLSLTLGVPPKSFVPCNLGHIHYDTKREVGV